MAYLSRNASSSDSLSTSEPLQPNTPGYYFAEYTQDWIDSINVEGSTSIRADDNYAATLCANQQPYATTPDLNLLPAFDDASINYITPDHVPSGGTYPIDSALFQNCQDLPHQDRTNSLPSLSYRTLSESAQDPGPRISKRGRHPRKTRIVEVDNYGLKIKAVAAEGRASKLYKCDYLDKEGQKCDGAFTRSGHHERHLVKHQPADKRKFPCPLNSCQMRFSRSDNASDHFKSHLKGPTRTQRNRHCEIEELVDALKSSYDPQMARKIIDKLNEWLISGKDRPGVV